MEQSASQLPPSFASPSSSVDGSGDLQCIGQMEIPRPKPVGFLCGSIPVPTDSSFHSFSSALVPSCQTVTGPRYRMLPTETDLNCPPLLTSFPEKVLPLAAVHSRATGDISCEANAPASNLTKKCEALAVSALVEYGDEIDVIAPADILKQIFKIPYSKSRVSIAVQRVGQTLVLNTGPDVEEGEKVIRRHKNQSKCPEHVDESLFLNFAMHSVRMEACDCPPTHRPPSEGHPSSSALPGGDNSQRVRQNGNLSPEDGFHISPEYNKQVKQDGFVWDNKKTKRNKRHEPIKKASRVSENTQSLVQESDKQRRTGNNEFLRVLFWQFHNFRMLLGSDLLLFSNDKYVAVSLHLWDVSRQVTPINWLEAWLDNIMASVPELAICYHQNGVVQGYELLKTDDIFLLKGISEDGTPAFHPHVVHQNGLSVLRFLQGNCKQDPGAYWLYKSAGEDVIQLFDLSIIPKNHSSSDCSDNSSSIPSLIRRGRSDSLFSLGSLLYRVGHRLSLSEAPNDRAKCVRFLRKCLDFLDEPDHMVVRALAHEQFARLILNYDEELDLTSESFHVECEVMVTDAEEESLDTFTVDLQSDATIISEDNFSKDHTNSDLAPSVTVKMTSEADMSSLEELIASSDPESSGNHNFAICPKSPASVPLLQTVTDSISSKLAAIHHVSQAIKSLRWTRQLQHSEPELVDKNDRSHDILPSFLNFSICACGDSDCIEVCDIREWLPTSKLDHKLWKLVLLLGESYLSLGEAYKEDGQLHQALKTVQLACSIYGSMPQKLEETSFVSSLVKCFSPQTELLVDDLEKVKSSPGNPALEKLSSTYLFWAKTWMLVGDVYVEFHVVKGKKISKQAEKKPSTNELRMSSEVVKEVQRLKRKLAQKNHNCSLCSLVNCSCLSDRASSGNSASSSSSDACSVAYSRKHSKRTHSKNVPNAFQRNLEDDHTNGKAESRNNSGEILASSISTSTGTDLRSIEDSLEIKNIEHAKQTETKSKRRSRGKNGGIFKYLEGPQAEDTERNLLAALSCYEEAQKALWGLPKGSSEWQSVMKKTGWVCNELGRFRLESKELNKAEAAFTDAINAFREVYDHSNIILINCNLGHGRRALAEEMVSELEALKMHRVFQNVYRQALETAKLEYSKSLRYYVAAKLELDYACLGSNSLKNEVYTQLAHTYLRLGMLLAKEDATALVHEHGTLEDTYVASNIRARKDLRKHEISANDAIREALALYESLGELRKQEAAYAYFQLACHHRGCCLRFLELDHKGNSPKSESNIIQRAKQYVSLAERNWQKSLDFYGPMTHPAMHLTILLERSALSFSLSNSLRLNAMLDLALSSLLEGRHVSETFSDTLRSDYPEMHAKFWGQLQMILKRMLTLSLQANQNKSPAISQSSQASNRSGDAAKLKELYKMSLKPKGLSDLHAMHLLLTS